MQIWNYLKEEHIFLNAILPDKESIFHFIANVCVQSHIAAEARIVYDALVRREQAMSTGIGEGIGLPHAVIPDVNDATLVMIRLANPIDFKSLDNRPVDLIISMVIPSQQTGLHLRLLASISRLCKNRDFLKTVRKADDSVKLWEAIRKLEDQMAFH